MIPASDPHTDGTNIKEGNEGSGESEQWMVLSCADDWTLRLWDMSNGECVRVMGQAPQDLKKKKGEGAMGKKSPKGSQVIVAAEPEPKPEREPETETGEPETVGPITPLARALVGNKNTGKR